VDLVAVSVVALLAEVDSVVDLAEADFLAVELAVVGNLLLF
jgi:hypothetical protein